MSERTSGPWAVGEFDDFRETYEVVKADSVRNGPGYRVQTTICNECIEADAWLIAAAPDLLAALEDITKHIHMDIGMQRRAQGAIDKARGAK